uniref:Uncharacterized protein n=1 Tax=Siphoviridae sp. ct2D011 TaxID=2825314 RepID=A0A8S5V9C0_9CAUD|nr:MAG TPA: hypothetical protein [Siphoviridae sp. ct2D011]
MQDIVSNENKFHLPNRKNLKFLLKFFYHFV